MADSDICCYCCFSTTLVALCLYFAGSFFFLNKFDATFKEKNPRLFCWSEPAMELQKINLKWYWLWVMGIIQWSKKLFLEAKFLIHLVGKGWTSCNQKTQGLVAYECYTPPVFSKCWYIEFSFSFSNLTVAVNQYTVFSCSILCTLAYLV